MSRTSSTMTGMERRARNTPPGPTHCPTHTSIPYFLGIS